MRPTRPRLAAAVAALSVAAAVALSPSPAAGRGDLTRAQRVDLIGIKRDAVRVGGLIRRGATEEAKTMFADVEARYEKLKQDAGDGLAGDRYAALVEEELTEHRSALAAGGAPAAEEPHPAMDDDAAPGMAGGMPPGGGAMEGGDMPAGGGAGGLTFSQDVAPTLVNSCGRCHMNGQARGGFEMNSYQELMDSGYVDTDDPEGGRMVRLMGQIEQPKMPPGNARIRRSQWENARDWVVAGAKLDKGEPGAPMRLLVPTEAQLRRAAMAKMDDAELAASRLERAQELYKKALPRSGAPTVVETSASESSATGGLILIGNVDEARLNQIAGWIKTDAARLAPLAGPDGLGGRGPLTVFVMKDRLDYQDFHTAAHGVFEVPASVTADATVPADGSDAYVALQDLRDDATASDPGMRANVIVGLAEAAMEGRGGEVPDWLSAGLGPAVAFDADPQNPALRALAERLPAALARLSKADDLLKPGTFAPEEVPAVGAALVSLLRKNGGDAKLGKLLDAMAAEPAEEQPAGAMNRPNRRRDRDGGAAALAQVYGVTPAQLAAGLMAAARGR